MARKRSVPVFMRLSPGTVAILDQLADSTKGSRSEVVSVLLSQATIRTVVEPVRKITLIEPDRER